jgi:hypothetical protein
VGWVERDDARRSVTASEIRLPDGEVTASCKALIARPPEHLMEGWLAEREHWRIDKE